MQGEMGDAPSADEATVDLWGPVRHALASPPAVDPDAEPATASEVRAELRRMQGEMASHSYASMATALPALLRDSAGVGDRGLRSHVLGMTGWLLTQNRQWGDAALVLDRAVDVADDETTAAAAVATRVWCEVRQGHLEAARALAIEWADRIEPRFSRATTGQMAAWGRLWLYIATVGVRDNRGGEHEDAMGMARAAAARIGREVLTEASTTRQFGPITVEHAAAESAAIAGQPALALAIAERTPPATFLPTAAGRLRHRLDKANAHTQLGRWDDAVGELRTLGQIAPEWITQQQYARDIVSDVITRRRTLTDEMRDLADLVKLEH
ncbi:transcriptional regulator [Nocardia sp. NPDC058640]|uniref:transcriptional regulator n=1 Tax=Nocardia sp. NPDC058640 TaxID=3346571 RepID=UPI0036675972